MSKFKVGDKVKNGRYEGVITNVKTKTTYTMTTEREGAYSNLSDKDLKLLKPYKTPHQELLDLGWVIDEDDKNETRIFYYKNKRVIRINRINKTCLTAINVDLQLAKILVRYLEELE